MKGTSAVPVNLIRSVGIELTGEKTVFQGFTVTDIWVFPYIAAHVLSPREIGFESRALRKALANFIYMPVIGNWEFLDPQFRQQTDKPLVVFPVFIIATDF